MESNRLDIKSPKRKQSFFIFTLSLLLLSVAGCSESPSYPREWPPLASVATKIGDQSCPDLTGTYVLPKTLTLPMHGAKRKDQFVELHQFLTVDPSRVGNSNRRRSIPRPSKMKLEGPTANGLRVLFLSINDEVVTDQTIKIGIDFKCLGRWIADAKPTHTRAQPRHYYAKDSQGYLIGHKAFSGGGLVLLLGFIPLPAFADDHEWWRFEPSST